MKDLSLLQGRIAVFERSMIIEMLLVAPAAALLRGGWRSCGRILHIDHSGVRAGK